MPTSNTTSLTRRSLFALGGLTAGALALGEPVTPLSLLGTVLILGGLAVSEWRAGRGSDGGERATRGTEPEEA